MTDAKCTCKSCLARIKENSSSIMCFSCKEWYHKKCSLIPHTDFPKIANAIKKQGYKWKCSDCNIEVSVINFDSDNDDLPNPDQLISKMETMFKKYFVPFKQEIDRKLEAIKKDLKAITDSNKKVMEDNAATRLIVEKLEKRVEGIESAGFGHEAIIAEVIERKKEENCIVAFNIPESNELESVKRQQDDKAALAEVLPENCNINIENIKVHRIGKPATGKTRPLRVELPSSYAAIAILKSRPKIGSTVKFRSDQTKNQRDYLNNLRLELNQRRDKGESDINIKYLNGIPSNIKNSNFHRGKRHPEQK